MTRQLALASIAASAVVITLCYASAFAPGGAPAWIGWPFMIATSLSLVGAMTLGAVRRGTSLGPLAIPFALTLVILIGGFGLALMQPAPTVESRLWFGLPAGAALVLYGVGLLPVLILPLAYALTFDRYTLSGDDLDRVRRQVAELQAADRASHADASGHGHMAARPPLGAPAARTAEGV